MTFDYREAFAKATGSNEKKDYIRFNQKLNLFLFNAVFEIAKKSHAQSERRHMGNIYDYFGIAHNTYFRGCTKGEITIDSAKANKLAAWIGIDVDIVTCEIPLLLGVNYEQAFDKFDSFFVNNYKKKYYEKLIKFLDYPTEEDFVNKEHLKAARDEYYERRNKLESYLEEILLIDANRERYRKYFKDDTLFKIYDAFANLKIKSTEDRKKEAVLKNISATKEVLDSNISVEVLDMLSDEELQDILEILKRSMHTVSTIIEYRKLSRKK